MICDSKPPDLTHNPLNHKFAFIFSSENEPIPDYDLLINSLQKSSSLLLSIIIWHLHFF